MKIDYRSAAYNLEVLCVAKMIYDLNRPDILCELGDYSVDNDYRNEFALTAIENVFGYTKSNSDESGENSSYYSNFTKERHNLTTYLLHAV